MLKLLQSNDDVPYNNVIRKLYCTENNYKPVRQESILIDSNLIDHHIEDKDEHNVSTSRLNHIYHHIPKNDNLQDKQTFDGDKWIYDRGKWKPPSTPTPIEPNDKANIYTLSDENKHKAYTGAQSDSGANAIVTNDITLLKNVKMIDNYPMNGCNKNDPAAIVCTALGMMPMQTTTGEILWVKTYYSAELDGTLISPTTLVRQHSDRFSGWMQYSDLDCDTGKIVLIGKGAQADVKFKIISQNDLWYHDPKCIGPIPSDVKPRINRLTSAAQYELWHQRTAHAGASTLESLHLHAKGVPKVRGNAFFRCPSCMAGKLCTKRAIGKKEKKTRIKNAKNEMTQKLDDIVDDIHMPDAAPGQHFHMDFGFVRGSEYRMKTEDGKTVTSRDGKNSYLLIIDRSSRYIWVFLSDTKKPPIEVTKLLLNKFKSSNPIRTVRVDQGGELGKSDAFKTMIAESGFTLEPTGADSSAQNGLAENPNRTFGQMMRCILHSAEMGPEFWSYALMHAVYIKNRLPHSSIKTTPHEAFTGIKPDLSRLRIFGSRVYARMPGMRKAKLDSNTYKGYFLGYTATDKNVYYIDSDSGKIKIGTHVIFDEAHMSEPASKVPLAAQTLQRLGYSAREHYDDEHWNSKALQPDLLIQQLTTTSTVPTRATEESIGYDLYFDGDKEITILAGTIMPLKTGIAIECPTGTYARIAPRSGLTVKNNLTTMAGVIDPDYRGDITVLLQNFGKEHQVIKPNQRIAQLILEKASIPPVQIVDNLTTTTRDQNGFGSTEVIEERQQQTTSKNDEQSEQPDTHEQPIESTTPIDTESATKTTESPIKDHNIVITSKFPNWNPPQIHPSVTTHVPQTAAAAKLFADIQTTFEQPFAINLSYDPFDNHTHRNLDIRKTDSDPYLGLVLSLCPDRQLPMLIDCKKGTSAARLQRWRRELRQGYITSINDTHVTSLNEIKEAISKARMNNQSNIKIGFSTIEKQNIHPQYGIPQMYHDQLNVIGKHLWEIRNTPEWNTKVQEEIVFHLADEQKLKIEKDHKKKLGSNKLWHQMHHAPKGSKLAALKKRKKLTRRFLKQQDDWDDWIKSERKQLNQYEDQGTFGSPCKQPPNSNVLPLLWTYLIKDCGTKKARCVCNGSPKMKGTVTLGDTYASSLDQTGSRIFWAATAINNYITIGADASNAFAEAPAPKAPLYVTIDQPFRDWYKDKYPDKPDIPKDYVLPVHGALQGHPESARLWAKLIDKIIQELDLKPCTHEPCLYYTNNYNNKGQKILFLRQVDDFAVACESRTLASDIISKINDKMTIDVKELGLISRFNGVDVQQSRQYIKIYNKTYINKILVRHPWINNDEHFDPIFPLPMISDNHYLHKLEEQPVPTAQEIKQLESEFGFGYRQAIGELIYALVTCRPDISFPVIKLSQYSTRPSRFHFEAIKNIYRYLNATKDEGIHFWRNEQRMDLPDDPIPHCKNDNNYNEDEIHERKQEQHTTMFGAVDSDYAGDKEHRRSVTGIILRIGGGTILYKTKFQDTIALSSTESEFTAAAEAAKYILYIRSILDQIGLPQNHATILYEDNQGALLMANAQQPTKRTRHMDIKTFAIQEWVERDLLTLKRINTSDNYADVMTKQTGRTLFYRHMNYILGKIRPTYVMQNKATLSRLDTLEHTKKTLSRAREGEIRTTGYPDNIE
jgi:deoxyuridine 5'-triphosphate nucleotidohydrolase